MDRTKHRLWIDNSKKMQFNLAWHDFEKGLQAYRVWQSWALQDIKLRYRRSVLGPLWLTITMAITIAAMGIIYSKLFHINTLQYIPFLTAGIIGWTLISGLTNDLMDAFISNESLIKQIRLPFLLYIHRAIWRNMIILAHNLGVWFFVILLFPTSMHSLIALILFFPDLLLIYLNALSIGIILAMISARYRDFPLIMKNVLQVLFFYYSSDVATTKFTS